MKKLILLLSVVAILGSCEKIKSLNPFQKEKETKNQCAVVSAELLPAAVSDSFKVKYPGATVSSWFNKDNTGYCAIITYNSQQMKVMFDNNGKFVSEEVEIDNGNQTGNHQDANSNDSGCECSLPESDSK